MFCAGIWSVFAQWLWWEKWISHHMFMSFSRVDFLSHTFSQGGLAAVALVGGGLKEDGLGLEPGCRVASPLLRGCDCPVRGGGRSQATAEALRVGCRPAKFPSSVCICPSWRWHPQSER